MSLRNLFLTKAIAGGAGSGGGGSGVQPDWNQNNETAADYVKNRTHYVEYVEKVYEYDPSDVGILEGFPVFAVGDTVAVTVGGVEYSLVAFDDEGYPTIGDSYANLENSTDAQYGWQLYVDPGMGIIFYANEAVTVSCVGEKVAPLDRKYIPNYNAVMFYLNTLIGEYSNCANFNGAYDNRIVVYSVSPDVNFALLPEVSMCDFGNLGYAQKGDVGLFFVSFAYSRLGVATTDTIALVHSDAVDEGIAEVKETYGVQ